MAATTPDEGATSVAEPVTNEAAIQPGDMIISTDESGTPAMVPAEVETEKKEESSEETPAEQTDSKESQAEATETDDEIVEWAKKKGIEIDPTNANEVKLARVNLENDRRFHENQTKIRVSPPELLPDVEDSTINAVVERQNANELKGYVRDWFDANPDMKEYREELRQISEQRPYLLDMDDVAGHLYRDPKFTAKLRSEGGKAALTNLAQKQSNIPPSAAASNTGVYQSDTITPQNVYAQVDAHDQEWFQKNHKQISKAMEGK